MQRLGAMCLVCLAVLTGCGYTTGSLLPERFQTIYIEPFKNSINYSDDVNRDLYEPLMEVKVRQAVSDRFLFDGNLRPGSKESADLVLKGELIRFERGDLRLDTNDDVKEFRLNVIVSLELWDTQKQEVRWSQSAFAGESSYFVTGDRATSDDAAIDDAIEDLAKRIVEKTIEDW